MSSVAPGLEAGLLKPLSDRRGGAPGARAIAPPSSTELSTEVDEPIDSLIPRSGLFVQAADLGIASWDSPAIVPWTAPHRSPHLGHSGVATPQWRQLNPTDRSSQGLVGRQALEGHGSVEVELVDDRTSTAGARIVVIRGLTTPDDRLRLGATALREACEAVVNAATLGQTIILTSALYVGCTRDLLILPLERRGFAVGQDVHVVFCRIPGAGDKRIRTGRQIVGGATATSADVAAAIIRRTGDIQIVETPEEAEASALAAIRPSGPGAAAKRAFDLAIAGLGLVLITPILALIALAIFIDDGHAPFFSQDRIGRAGRAFRIRKFRTMVAGAEARLADVWGMNEIRGPGFQLEHDPRLTRLGRFLRRSSLDELPQLWNVLRGDMSLVGPRPAPLIEISGYEPWHRARLTAKPGITGLAQIVARSYRDFDEKASLDLEYITGWSMWLDVKIMLRTVPLVLRLTGR